MGIDQAWLDTINAERKKDQSGAISYEAFEIIMDKLEKEWFNLVRIVCFEVDEADDPDQAHSPTCFARASRGLQMCSL